MPKFRTPVQNRKMFGLAAKCGVGHEVLKDYAAEITNGRTERTSKLYINEADAIIHRLEAALATRNTPVRTVRYHRQQQGVKAIVTQAHLDKLQRLANGRKMTADGLKSLCRRMLKDASGNPLERPRTTAECNSVIEAIKAMNKRDSLVRASKKQEAA